MPASVPFSNDGEPQDNNEGRPKGTSSNNGRGRDTPGQGRDRAAPRRIVHRNAGETVRAVVEDNEVSYFGETTLAILDDLEGDVELGYVTEVEREAIASAEPMRNGRSLIVPVNTGVRCSDTLRLIKLDDGLRMVVGERIGDAAIVAKALRFSEPHYDLNRANEYALRWGFIEDPLVADTIVCPQCRGTGEIEGGTMVGMMKCPTCKGLGRIEGGLPAGGSGSGSGDADVAEAAKRRRRHARAAGIRYCVGCGLPVGQGVTSCPSCGLDPDGDGDVDPAGGGGDPPGT
jgi:hypothetical protein